MASLPAQTTRNRKPIAIICKTPKPLSRQGESARLSTINREYRAIGSIGRLIHRSIRYSISGLRQSRSSVAKQPWTALAAIAHGSGNPGDA